MVYILAIFVVRKYGIHLRKNQKNQKNVHDKYIILTLFEAF